MKIGASRSDSKNNRGVYMPSVIPPQHARTALLLGEEAIARLTNSRVAVFGVGGVGSFAAEALARAGIGRLDLVDNDTVSESNLNRQLVALHSTLGKLKVDVMRERVLDINPACHVKAWPVFFAAAALDKFDFSVYDYVVDAIDTVQSKLLLIEACDKAGTRIISCMGAGNKLDPTRFEVADIYATSVCPLAKVMRRELRRLGIEQLKVVYSKEEPIQGTGIRVQESGKGRRPVPGSVSFVPGAAGLVLAGEVIKELGVRDQEAGETAT